MYPNDQVRMVEAAGRDIFGPLVNTKMSRSVAWNVARAAAFCKSCSEVANIPSHPNVGMGVGGVPMCETPPADAVTRVSKSLVEIGKADGLQVGVGDPMGMPVAHVPASGLGGIRAAGDLVAWMQITCKMRIND